MLRFNNMVSSGQAFLKVFQYILCYGSTVFISAIGVQFLYFNTSYVTVQLLKKFFIKLYKKISIHLMLRFNIMRSFAWQSTIKISIHLMLRFNKATWSYIVDIGIFQYILCYGSTTFVDGIENVLFYFNTSYVTVQQHGFVRAGISESISIHLMLRFNGFYKCYWGTVSLFQYILCYGSTRM